jgi:hypothetical protein
MVFFSEVKRAACFLPPLSSFGENPAAVKSFYGNISMVIFFQRGGSFVFSLEVKRVAYSLPLPSSLERNFAAVKSFLR